MATHAHPHGPASGALARLLVVGALSGAASALVFHVGMAAGHFAWPLLLRGALLGALLAATLARLQGARLVLAATAFGALVPTLAALVFVAPHYGQPPVTGVVPLALLARALVNAAWGFGTGLGLALFGRELPR